MQATGCSLAAVSDPYRPGKKLPQLAHGFHSIAVEKDPAALIIVHKAPFDLCPLITSELVVALYCKAQGFEFTFISAYAPPHRSMEPTLLVVEQALALSRTPNIIIAGDFNAKHAAWGAQLSDPRGSRLVEFMSTHGLLLLNDAASIPTYETRYSMSWIDVTLATPSAIVAGYTWRVLEEVTFSEHRYIEVVVGDQLVRRHKRLTRYSREQLLTSLSSEPWFAQVTQAQLQSAESLDRVVTQFYRLLERYLHKYLRPVKGTRRGNPWWTPQLAQERRRVNALRRRYQRCKNDALRDLFRVQYSVALAAFRRETARAKDSYLRGFCAECAKRSLFSAPFKEAFGRQRTDLVLPPLRKEDGTYTSTHLEAATLLLQTQVALDDHTSDDSDHAAVRSLAAAPYWTREQDTPFSPSELESTVRQMKDRSAPGPDGLTPSLVKGLVSIHTPFLLWLFNSALRLGHFPSCWRRGRIIFIRKPGRLSELTTSYRPICVNSVLGKVLERLLNSRLYYFLHRGGHIHSNQYGFTHAKSAVLALHSLHEQLLSLKASKKPAILMALDFQGAFDSVWHPCVLQFFRERGLPSCLYHLLRTFLTDRTVVFSSNAGRVEAHPSLGSPQGSPISPLLWNVIIHGLLSLPMPEGVVVQAYADDTVILIPGAKRQELSDKASEVLRRVDKWAAQVKVKLSREKTSCVLFSHGVGGMERVRPTVRTDSSQPGLKYTDTLRILGVVFDRRLSFFAHADFLRDKINHVSAKVVAFKTMTAAVKPAALRLLYRQVILPVISYASPIWWPERPDCRLKSRLISAQRTALLALTGAYKTTRTAALQVLVHALPIEMELRLQNRQFTFLKLRRTITSDGITWDPTTVALPLDKWHSHPAHTSPSVKVQRLTVSEARNMARHPGIHVYTDGAYTSLSAGAAYVILGRATSIVSIGRFKVEKATSAYCTEIIALTEALQYLVTDISLESIYVYTDCLSVLQALANPYCLDPRVHLLRDLISRISSVRSFAIFHIPGHRGIFGNELADFLAMKSCGLGLPRTALTSLLVTTFRTFHPNYRTQHTHTHPVCDGLSCPHAGPLAVEGWGPSPTRVRQTIVRAFRSPLQRYTHVGRHPEFPGTAPRTMGPCYLGLRDGDIVTWDRWLMDLELDTCRLRPC
ncbi:hypothetical protein HPB52_023785 [Rhipicephalus sanguineus]|uniref:Tick transposon n=1 Tax=Rhipicephalus sanguineus TaxID=34632 RepID=A0A9D4T2H3_RHISA|nr:hypothetical protein HPB52_023785 [Rhipicephalus sanguineus]